MIGDSNMMKVRDFDRRAFLKVMSVGAWTLSLPESGRSETPAPRPNILFCIADDWGWPHAGMYGDPVVQTPTFDRLAREGVLFEHAFVSSPSCTPCRNAILTGQYHWRLEEGANLWSTLDVTFPVYPLLLEETGYHVGHWRKCFGPGDLKAGGYGDRHPGGKRYPKGFQQFLKARPEGKPFCSWLGSSDPHRPYKAGSGREAGIDPSKIKVPGFYPDVPEIRSDMADYCFEVQRFDSDCAQAIALLEATGELDNTLIVMTGDHGMPFPRCKSNLYEMGVHVPLAVRFGAKVKPGRRVTDFVSFVDFAPTFLEAAGVAVPEGMTGRSLIPILESDRSGRIEPARDHVIFGKERHVPAQARPSMAGYPCRGLCTDRYLYIRNFKPDLWPAGVPEGAARPSGHFAGCDGGPTKAFLMDHRDDPKIRPYYDLAFAKRPAEELFDLAADPDQLKNLAGETSHLKVKYELAAKLMSELKAAADPRVTEEPARFDEYPYRARYKLNTSSESKTGKR